MEKDTPFKWEAKESWSSNPYIKIDLKLKKTARDKGGHYIMIKGSIIDEDITIVNNYAPNIIAPRNMRQTLTDIKRGTGSNIIIVTDDKTPLRWMGRSSTLKI